jgi:RNA 3'-terminal phosphate cyclase (ATP)
VGRFLADQLMVPMALAGGGGFMTLPPTRHTTTNAEVIQAFMEVDVRLEKIDRLQWHVQIEAR